MRKLRSVLRFLLKRSTRERELDSELRFHLEHLTEENIRRGMEPQQARLAARRSIGGMEQIKEQCRDARLGRAVEATLQDIRYGFRVLFKNPGFTCAAVLTLALGIGVNTAIFSLVYGILLRPLPYRQGAQLVVLHQVATHAHLADVPFSAKEIFDYRDQNHTLQSVVEHHTMYFLLLGDDWAERVNSAIVSANFFDVLGVKPLLGRTFRASDDSPKADAVLVLSYGYWRNRFGGNPKVIGQVLRMNNRPHTVIGVLPPIPQYPEESDIYMPVSACPYRSDPKFIANRDSRMMMAFGRLKPGVSLARARSDLSTIAARLEKAYPSSYPKEYGYGITAVPLRTELTRGARGTFPLLLGAAGFVLLIACANVANLFLARLLKLDRELSVRAALGASRLRLVRQLLTESLLISVGGGVLGVCAAPPAVALLIKFAARFTTRAAEVKLDTPVLLFSLLLSICTGLLFGVAPAFASGGRAGAGLREGFARMTSGPGRQKMRSALVIVQLAISFVLLMGAGLLIRSFMKLQEVNPGFNPERLLTLRLSPNFSRYQVDELGKVSREIRSSVDSLSGVESSALASNFPFNPDELATDPDTEGIELSGRPARKGELMPRASLLFITPEYFRVIGQPLVSGRAFTEHDSAAAVAIVNSAMARHRWPNQNPIGERIKITGETPPRWRTVIGVAGDVREYGLTRTPADELYLVNGFSHHLIVHTNVDPLTVVPRIRAALHRLDRQLAIDQVNSIENYEHDSIASPRVTAMLLGIFAALAILISASGIAAVIALGVAQRRRELGIRMALGAQPQGLLRSIVRDGLALTAAGAVIGITGGILFTRLLSALLFETSPTDVPTFSAILALFFVIAALACFVPARQVIGIDPTIALRQE